MAFGSKIIFLIALGTSFLLYERVEGADPNPKSSSDSLPRPILAYSFEKVTSSVISDDSRSGNVYISVAYDISGPFIPTTGPSFPGSGKAFYFDGMTLLVQMHQGRSNY